MARRAVAAQGELVRVSAEFERLARDEIKRLAEAMGKGRVASARDVMALATLVGMAPTEVVELVHAAAGGAKQFAAAYGTGLGDADVKPCYELVRSQMQQLNDLRNGQVVMYGRVEALFKSAWVGVRNRNAAMPARE